MIDAQKLAPFALGSYPLYILIEGINEAIANAMPDCRPGGYDMVVTLFMWGQDAHDQVWLIRSTSSAVRPPPPPTATVAAR